MGALGVMAPVVGRLWGGMQSKPHSQELTVSYTGCANFSLRHHSSRHILGVIWGEYALLEKGKGVRPNGHRHSITQQGPHSVPTGAAGTETLHCCPKFLYYSPDLPFLSYQQLGACFLPKGKMGFTMLRELGWEVNSSSLSSSLENSH